jgi:hypothetical protein
MVAALPLAARCATPQPEPVFVSEHDQAMEHRCSSLPDARARCECDAGRFEGQAIQQFDSHTRALLLFDAADQWLCANRSDRARKAYERVTIDPGASPMDRDAARAKIAELKAPRTGAQR